MRRIFVGLWVLGCGFGLPTSANSVAVVPRGDQPGSFQLALRLDGPGIATTTEGWIGFGPEKGLNNERWLTGRLRIDPSGLSVEAPGPGPSYRLQFLRLGASATETASVRFFLERRATRWWLGAEAWSPDMERYESVGKAPLTPDGQAAAMVEFEWRSSTDMGNGVLDVRRVEADGSLTPLFAREQPWSEGPGISLVQLGLSEPSQAGTVSGSLSIDDFSIHRGGSEPAGSTR